MPSDRIQRRIDAFLDEADSAATTGDWFAVAEKARAVLAIDADNEDARAFLKMAEANGARAAGIGFAADAAQSTPTAPPLPASFSRGRYRVLRLLGKGARKRVYLARDERLGREVALAVIPAGGLSAAEKERVLREAQAMARIGSDPHLVSIFDIGEDGDDLFTVQEFMSGGDVATLLALTPGTSSDPTGDGGRGTPGLAVERTLAIAKDICRALTAVHAAGIVHRDLKPANVFIGADGMARVGDLGLATNAGADRLTQQGTMLGTVSYMPPEQALGGDVSPKADLYSFGAMLYEMVTGRPPFVGDDPTAVISQHINTPPVAPSWVTEHCPPALEEIILRLLAKDPGQRPASAAEVLAALEKVEPAQKSASHSDSNALDRLATGVFVGREKELDRLRKAFDGAFAGRGGLVMLVGEPGIGKTRTTQELETYARMRGATVLWGRTHESSGAPPYWPWLQIGNQFVATYPALAAKLALSPETLGELGRLFPFLKSQPNYVEPREAYSPEAAQFRLFDAYATFLRAISEQTPLLVALDDLHWADKPTLQLLQHVARDLGRGRVLIAGNYRDTDITRQSALSETLAALNRESANERIVLRGLTKEEVRAYIRAKANIEPRREVLDRIYEETEGNAFFLSEVVNLMAEEGSLSKESISDIAIPDGVKEALGRRLNRLSPEANEMLQVATVIGREFSYDTLTLLGDRDEDALLKQIEEAIEARVIEELPQPGRYRFTHAQMQETLLAELSTTRRVRLHGQVGEALEKRYGDRAEENAARLAIHFAEASALAPRFAEKARAYALMAAQRAEKQFAWDEAVRWYEQAIADVSEPVASTLSALARAAVHSGGPWQLEAWPTLVRALDAFRKDRDTPGFIQALLGFPVVGGAAYLEQEPPLLREAIQASESGSDLVTMVTVRSRLLYSLHLTIGPDISRDEMVTLENDLLRLVASDPTPLGESVRGFVGDVRANRLGNLRDAAQFCHLWADASLSAGSVDLGLAPLGLAAHEAAALGNLDVAAADAARLMERSFLQRDTGGADFSMFVAASVAMLRCEWDAVHANISERDMPFMAPRLGELHGEAARIVSSLPSAWVPTVNAPWFDLQRCAYYAAFMLHAGRPQEAAENFARWAKVWQAGFGLIIQRVQSFSAIEPCIRQFGSDDLWSAVWHEVSDWKNYCGPWSGMGIDPARGQLALRLGLVEEARQAFEDGLEWSERERCPIEAGRNLQGLAAIAELEGDSHQALALLDRAAAYFQPHDARLYLDMVIGKKVAIQGLTGDSSTSIALVSTAVQAERPDISIHAADDGTVTLLFSDIENSTAQNDALGDALWMDLLHAHNAVIRRNLARFGGHEVKSMGDGFMLVFASPVRAVQYAVATQGELAMAAGLEGVRVRMGIHAGDAVREAGDFFGREVNYAARVASCAVGGEIVVSGAIHDRVQGEFVLSEPRTVTLKGFAGDHPVYAVR